MRTAPPLSTRPARPRWVPAAARRLPTAVADALFLAAVVVVSVLPYVGRLGFYSDDWVFLSRFHDPPGQSLLDLVRVADMPSRPVQAVYLAVLHKLFGLHPLGYHLVHTAVLAATAVLFYAVLRQLRLPRALALSVPLLYAALPHYSTDRFWAATFQAALSMLFYFASFLCTVRGFSSSGRRSWLWLGLGLVGMIVSGLAYEVALPLFVLTPVVVWLRRPTAPPPSPSARTKLVVAAGSALLVLVVLALFKEATASRVGAGDGLRAHFVNLFDNALDPGGGGEYGFNVRKAVAVNYWKLGAGLPLSAARLARHGVDAAVLAVAALVAAAAFALLYRRDPEGTGPPWSRRHLAGLAGLGFVAFLAGYAIFLTNWNVQITPTGIGNRTAIAAAVGVAVVAAAAVAGLATLLPRGPARRAGFAGLVALAVFAGVAVNGMTASYWERAYDEERATVAAVTAALPTLPRHADVLLDGRCPYVGPAVVFEAEWDLAGALRIAYGDKTLRADVVKPGQTLGPDGVSQWLYNQERVYRYGPRLFVYNATGRRVYRLDTAEAARRYFARGGPGDNRTCKGKPGVGVWVL